MKFDYRLYRRNGYVIYQPIISIEIDGSGFDGLVDSGADFVWLPTTEPLSREDGKMDSLDGDGESIPVMFKEVTLKISKKGGDVYEWNSRILYSHANIKPVLGYRGFLEFFKVILDTESMIFTIESNKNFPGYTKDFWEEN